MTEEVILEAAEIGHGVFCHLDAGRYWYLLVSSRMQAMVLVEVYATPGVNRAYSRNQGWGFP